MKLTAPKTLVLADLATVNCVFEQFSIVPDNTLACAVGAVSFGRICGNS